MINSFLSGVDSVNFSNTPLRSSTAPISMSQPSGRVTDGSFYAYTKSINSRTMHTLKFITDKTVLDALLDFHATKVNGTKTEFTWTDHENQSHTVHFATADISWKHTGPDRYETSVMLREDLIL